MEPAEEQHEVVLQGGTTGPVVRVGDTVRRRTGPWSEAVHALLIHLEDVGYDGAPRFLGIDTNGREVLSYISGDVTAQRPVLGMYELDALLAAAARLRDYHVAASTFVAPPDSRWRVQPGAPTSGAIVCHNDVGPHNTIYRAGMPSAFIDWDFAAPATPLWDVVYAAWLFVPLFQEGRLRVMGWPNVDVRSRLVAFCDAYELEERGKFIEVLRRRQQVTHDLFVQWGAAGVTGFPRLLREGRDTGVLDDMAYLDEQAEAWQTALDRG